MSDVFPAARVNGQAIRREVLSNPSLVLIDALALAYRAFHAIPPLHARDGTPTHALLGFVKAVRLLCERFQPTHAAAVFDGGLPADRMNQLPEYKAQRPPMPDALARQLPLIEEFLDAESVCRFRIDGEEADDVLASLACQAAGQGARVWIASNDKDLYQIVSDRISLVAPTKNAPVLGPSEIREKTGVRPDQIPDWLALAGDAVDNIPGVPGVGPKTAARLIEEFGSIDALYSNLDRLDVDRLKESLENAADQVRRNRAMIVLKRNLGPLPPFDSLAVKRPDAAKLSALFGRLDMPSLAPVVSDSSQMSLF
ncbi:MAG: hypothetical protein NZ740_04545 [Kiritimatiellae bacterium]|nr:hypothetical protein [Kiritimatiellia bacterium]MDW8458360.1 5'-3' exonuclease H3TH domain-containing protein [Verrucomicrobiota bacterium]